MSLRRIVTMVIGSMLVFSCTDDLVQENSQGMPIRIVSGTRTVTRAADGLNEDFANNTSIKVAVDGREYNYTTNGAGNPMTCTSATPPYFPIDGSSVKLQAYYPSNISYATTSQIFTVAESQNSDNNYKSSDLMYGEPSPNGTPAGWSGLDGDAKVMPTADPVPLVFQHKLVKIKVNITTNGATVSSVTLNNIKRRVPFTPSTGVLGSAEEYTGHTDVSMFSGSTTANFTCTAVIPPQTIGTSTNFLTVITSIHNLTYKLPAEVTFASGSQYIYNVTIFGSQISVTTNVTAWDESTATPVPGQGTLNRPKLPIEYIAPYNMYDATHMATDNLPIHSMYFSWNNSTAASGGVGDVNNPTINDDIKAFINGTAVAGYHLPSKAEFCSVFAPHYAQTTGNTDTSMGGNTGVRIAFEGGQHTGLTETVAWGVINNNTSSTWSANNYTYEVSQVFYNDYDCPNDGYHQHIGYGLRFKPTEFMNGEYTCGYRYEYKMADANVGGGASLTIMVRYVGPDQSVSIETVNKESWWTNPEYTVVLPACGYSPFTNGENKTADYYSTGPATNTDYGYYWTATVKDATYVYNTLFIASNVYGNTWNLPGCGFSVRLFKDR